MPVRVEILLHRRRLDRQLAEGVDPADSPALSSRARQLQGARHRRGLANGLQRLVRLAERHAARGVTTPVNKDEVLAARAALLELVERLRAPGPVEPRGVAMVRRLLGENGSPIYSPDWTNAKSASGELERRTQAALAALEGRPTDAFAGRSARR